MTNIAQKHSFHRSRARVRLSGAKLRSIGGETWTVSRHIGDGRSTRSKPQVIGTVQGHVHSYSPLQTEVIGSEILGVDLWKFSATPEGYTITSIAGPVDPPTVMEGDFITSVQDTSLVFQLGPVEVQQYIVESELKEQ